MNHYLTCLNFNIVYKGRILPIVMNFNNTRTNDYNINHFKQGKIIRADFEKKIFIGQFPTLLGDTIELVTDVPFLSLMGKQCFEKEFLRLSTQCDLIPIIPCITKIQSLNNI